MDTNNNVEPVYTKGKWAHNLHDGIVTSDGLTVANCNNPFVSKGTAKENANRIVLAVNNYDLLVARNKELLNDIKELRAAANRAFQQWK